MDNEGPSVIDYFERLIQVRYNFLDRAYGVLPQDLTKIPALTGGYRCDVGNIYDANEVGYWWTSSELSKSDSWDRSLDNKSTALKRTSANKGNGESIRCVRTAE